MMSDNIVNIQRGLSTSFLNATFQSNLAYRPQFIYNDNKNGQKVFSSIEEELLRCDSFAISVAFITRGGITPLLQTLKELQNRLNLSKHADVNLNRSLKQQDKSLKIQVLKLINLNL